MSIFFHRFFYKQCTHITNRERITHIQYIPNIGSPFLIKCLCFHPQTQPISRLNLIYVIFILIRRLGWVSMCPKFQNIRKISVSQSFLRKNVYVWAVAILNLTHAIFKLVWQATIVITRKFYYVFHFASVSSTLTSEGGQIDRSHGYDNSFELKTVYYLEPFF